VVELENEPKENEDTAETGREVRCRYFDSQITCNSVTAQSNKICLTPIYVVESFIVKVKSEGL